MLRSLQSPIRVYKNKDLQKKKGRTHHAANREKLCNHFYYPVFRRGCRAGFMPPPKQILFCYRSFCCARGSRMDCRAHGSELYALTAVQATMAAVGASLTELVLLAQSAVHRKRSKETQRQFKN